MNNNLKTKEKLDSQEQLQMKKENLKNNLEWKELELK